MAFNDIQVFSFITYIRLSRVNLNQCVLTLPTGRVSDWQMQNSILSLLYHVFITCLLKLISDRHLMDIANRCIFFWFCELCNYKTFLKYRFIFHKKTRQITFLNLNNLLVVWISDLQITLASLKHVLDDMVQNKLFKSKSETGSFIWWTYQWRISLTIVKQICIAFIYCPVYPRQIHRNIYEVYDFIEVWY